MSIGGVSGSYATAGANFRPSDKLPCLSKEQRAAMISQLKPIPVEELPPELAESLYVRPSPSGEAETTHVTAANGISVSVTQHPVPPLEDGSYTLHLGGEDSPFSIDFSDSIHIGKTEDGMYAVYFSNGGVTRAYAKDGSFTEMAGDQTDASTGRLFVSTTNNEVLQGGDGNDTFLVYGASSSVNTGEGDNTVIIKRGADYWRSGSCGTLTTGDGNNAIIVEGSFHGTMATGNGDNSISIGCLSGELSLGDGSNRVSIDAMQFGSINPGNGESSFTISKMGIMSRISTDLGVTSEDARRTFNIASMSRGSSIDLTGGSNTFNIGYMGDSTRFFQGGGELDLTIDQMGGSARVSSHAERASVSIHSMKDQANVSVCGNSSVLVEEMAGYASVYVSDLPGGKAILTGFDAEIKEAASEVLIGTMRDSAILSLTGSGHMVAIAAMLDEAELGLSSNWRDMDDQEAPKANIFISEADDTAGLPREDGNIYVLSELGQEALEAIKTMLANWRTEREEAGLSATKQDVWACLNGETSKEEELMRRVALLVSWN